MTELNEVLRWNDAVAAVDSAFAIAAPMKGDNPPGSLEEQQFTEACSGIAQAIARMVEAPAPDLAGVLQKLELLHTEMGGAEPDDLKNIMLDLARIGEADQYIQAKAAGGAGEIIQLMEIMADKLPADKDAVALLWLSSIHCIAGLLIALREKLPEYDLSGLVGAGGLMVAQVKRMTAETDIETLRTKSHENAIH